MRAPVVCAGAVLSIAALCACAGSSGSPPDGAGGDWSVGTWLKSYGGGLENVEPRSVVVTSDGGFGVAGSSTEDQRGKDLWVMAVAPDGEPLWSRRYGKPSGALPLVYFGPIAPTEDGAVAVLGSDSMERSAVVRVDPDGNAVWQRAYGGFNLDADIIRAAPDNRFLLLGQNGHYIEGQDLGINPWVLKIDGANGAPLAEQTLYTDIEAENMPGSFAAGDIAPMSGGRAAIVGEHMPTYVHVWEAYGVGYAALLSNTLSMTHLALHSAPVDLGDTRYRLNAAAPLPDGGLVVAGETTDDQMLLIRYDEELEEAWDILYETDVEVSGNAVALTGDGAFLVGGSMGSGDSRVPMAAWFDGDGNVLWVWTFEGDGPDGIRSITPLSANPSVDGFVLGTWNRILRITGEGTVVHEISAADVGPDLPWIEPWEVLPMDADKDGVRDDGFYVSTVIGLARLGADGSLQWVRTSSAEDEAEWAEQIVARPAGGFVVAGTAVSMDSRFKTGSRWDAWLLGLTQSGDVDWQALYGPHEHSWATSVVQMPDGYLFALNAGAGACILRLAEDGSEQWQHCYGREEDGFVVQRIATAPDGAIFVAGSSYELTIVQRLQADGSPDPAWSPWERVYATGTDDEEDDEGPASVSSLSLELLPDGGYLLGIEQLRGDILHVARIDPDGNPAWGWSIPRWYSHGRSPVLASPDGGAYIAWPTGATGPRKCSVAHQYDCPDLSLAHIDPTGTVVWQQTYATGMPDFPTAMVRASDCGLLVAGQTRGIAYPAWDAWLVKVGADGMISPSCPAWRSLDEPVYVIAGLLTRVSAAETSAPVPRPDLERVDASFMSQALTPVVTRSCYGEAPGRDPCGPPGARSGLDLAQLEDAVAEDTGSADAAADGSQDVPYVKDTGECVDAPADFNGIWEVHFTCKNSCGPQPVQSGVDMATVTQVGDFANIQEEMGSFVGHGHICGNEFSWSGSGMGYSESGTWFMHKDGSITKESHWQSDSELACGGDCTGDIYPSSEKP